MRSPFISIVIPSFNKGEFLGKTLQSIVSQGYKNYEVIIQDPGSTDGSVEIIKSFAKKYPGLIKAYFEKDKGQLDAVNKGIEKAKGELLTFINADDVYEKKAFVKVSEAYLKNPKSFWFAGEGRVINEKDKEVTKIITLYKNLLFKINRRNVLLVVNYLFQPSVFLTRKLINEFGKFKGNTHFIMEYDMWLRVAEKKMPTTIPSILSSFRIPEKSFSRNAFESTLSEDWRIVNTFTKNKFILLLHKLHNSGRKMIIRYV